jgi:hypothetical protein
VAVEKGTKAVISVNFSACGKRRFNNLRANFVREIPRKEFFNTHRRSHNFASFVRQTGEGKAQTRAIDFSPTMFIPAPGPSGREDYQ